MKLRSAVTLLLNAAMHAANSPAIAEDLSVSDAAPRLLSAFYGGDDIMGIGGPVTGCDAPLRALDGMPLVVSHEVRGDVDGLLDPRLFKVIASDGSAVVPVCASLRPADEENEDRTILLIGEFGTPLVAEPKKVIVGSLETEATHPVTGLSWNLRGSSVLVTPYEAGVTLVLAQTLPPSQWDRGSDDCPVRYTAGIVQLTFQGGVVSADGDELGKDSADLQHFTIEFADASQQHPLAFGDLNDGDNVLDLCLAISPAALAPIRVTVDSDTVLDPSGDPNDETSVFITPAIPRSGRGDADFTARRRGSPLTPF